MSLTNPSQPALIDKSERRNFTCIQSSAVHGRRSATLKHSWSCACRFSDGLWHSVLTVLSAVVVDFLLVGMAIATAGWCGCFSCVALWHTLLAASCDSYSKLCPRLCMRPTICTNVWGLPRCRSVESCEQVPEHCERTPMACWQVPGE